MKLDDILTFVKAGYKPSEIKELLEMETSSEVKTKNIQTPETATPNQQTEEDKPEAEEIDYKKLYEESQAQIKNLQKSNVNKDNSIHTEKSEEEILSELAISFY